MVEQQMVNLSIGVMPGQNKKEVGTPNMPDVEIFACFFLFSNNYKGWGKCEICQDVFHAVFDIC